MKSITLLASVPNGHPFPVVSHLIRFFEGSRTSHVGLLLPDTSLVADAHFNDIRISNEAKYLEENKVLASQSIEVTDDEYRAVFDLMTKKRGKQKGYWNTLLGSLIPLLVRVFSFKTIQLGNTCPFRKGYTCSEYVRFLLTESLILKNRWLECSIPEHTATTGDMLELMKIIAVH